MTKNTILWIAGSQVIMALSKKILERAGYSVRCAYGLAGAREWLVEYKPDIIILENELPDGNGLEYCRELRKEIVTPILFLSNIREEELLALQAGANDFMKKPYKQEIMVARVNILFNGVYRE